MDLKEGLGFYNKKLTQIKTTHKCTNCKDPTNCKNWIPGVINADGTESCGNYKPQTNSKFDSLVIEIQTNIHTLNREIEFGEEYCNQNYRSLAEHIGITLLQIEYVDNNSEIDVGDYRNNLNECIETLSSMIFKD